MRSTRLARSFGRGLTALSLAVLLLGGSGCATIIKGTTQTITVHIEEDDADVRYYGRPVPDGKLFRIEKRPGPPSVVYSTEAGDEFEVPLDYDVDPLFIVDFVLFIPGIIPGLIAVSVDLATGAWRDMHTHQHVSRRGAISSQSEDR